VYVLIVNYVFIVQTPDVYSSDMGDHLWHVLHALPDGVSQFGSAVI
jgi:hypothetical protein